MAAPVNRSSGKRLGTRTDAILPREREWSRKVLVIVHLSSLDAFHARTGCGDDLADRIIATMRRQDGPIIIVDQNWQYNLHSLPRQRVENAIPSKAVWLDFDEDTQSWADFERRLIQCLRKLANLRVSLGGVWYDPRGRGGCVNATASRLARHGYDVVIDEWISGEDPDCEPEDPPPTQS